VIQNQVGHYRLHGFQTRFVAVPFHWAYRSVSPIWNEITEGIYEIGADQTFIANLAPRSYTAAKYKSSFRHGFRGTSLDWMVDLGRASQLPPDTIQQFRDKPIALCHVNHVYTLGFALRLIQEITPPRLPVPVVLETHDIQSHLIAERGDINPWTKKRDSVERLLKTELAMLEKVDVLVHLSVDDMVFFQKHLPHKPHVLSVPTIDETFVSTVNETRVATDAIDLLFVGQSHAPNLEAMRWFFAEVWPRIADRKYKLKVVGNVELFVRESLPKVYEQFRPCFVGQTADLAPYYRAARCVIAPMVSGSGTSIKTIEALALGKPFVGTSKAYRGMPMRKIEAAGLRSYDSAQDFANALQWALANEAEAGARSREAYVHTFSTQAAFASRDIALQAALKKQQHI
jgi:glycosyltransferase involved in cell wall biosynthesis